ncbi:MAG: two-component system NarL family sensor kinase [Crocinitomicaceae bacterium]|jgi:two-component system NarL family sensor kinase
MEQWQTPETIATWITIGFLFVVVLVILILILVRSNFRRIIRSKLKESELKLNHRDDLLRSSILVQESERERIASDLHDVLINKLYVYKLSKSDTKDIQYVDECIETARRISHDLSPPILSGTTLEELIREVLFPWKKAFEVFLHVLNQIPADIPKDVKLQIIRILQETITNTYKHAEATQLVVDLKSFNSGLGVMVSDNGKGYNTDLNSGGLGLKNIESRAQFLGGYLKLKSRVGSGTRVILFIPYQNKS